VAVALELLLGFLLAMLVYKEFMVKSVYHHLPPPMMIVPWWWANFSMIYVDSGPLSSSWPRSTPLALTVFLAVLSGSSAVGGILADVWQWTSLTFLIFLSGFRPANSSTPPASGASRWQISGGCNCRCLSR
jgi:ABC-type sugar transport system permease subunit